MNSKHVRCLGGPVELQRDDIRVPAPGAGEVLVKVDAAGVNSADTHQSYGRRTARSPGVGTRARLGRSGHDPRTA